MRIYAICFVALMLEGCSIKPVRVNTADGSEQYFMDCGDDKRGCIVKANETCPQGYDVLEANQEKVYSSAPWHSGSSVEATLRIRCKAK